MGSPSDGEPGTPLLPTPEPPRAEPLPCIRSSRPAFQGTGTSTVATPFSHAVLYCAFHQETRKIQNRSTVTLEFGGGSSPGLEDPGNVRFPVSLAVQVHMWFFQISRTKVLEPFGLLFLPGSLGPSLDVSDSSPAIS